MLRPDGLLVWKWSPDPAARYPDTNSASDGDLLVAHGLLLAGKRFETPRYIEAGERLAAAVREKLIREAGRYTVLLPGPEGFTRSDGELVVNLSYWLFPTFELLADHTGDPIWLSLVESGRELIREAAFGAWDLPPDWLVLSPDGDPSLPDPAAFAPVFGYNALRVPLYLAWADRPADPDVLDRFRRYWAAQADAGGLPLVWDLTTDTPLERGRNPGVRAIRALIAEDATPDGEAAQPPSEGTHYYDAVLVLLACLADKGDSPCACAA
jgi:endoglucanase